MVINNCYGCGFRGTEVMCVACLPETAWVDIDMYAYSIYDNDQYVEDFNQETFRYYVGTGTLNARLGERILAEFQLTKM